MKKRIVSSIMCLAMLLSLLPGAAFAASTTPEPKIESVGYAELGATANNEITTALNAARGVQAGTNNAANVTDCDKQTMWAILTGLDTKNQYQFTLKHGSDTITISEDQAKTGKIGPGLPFTVTEGQKGVIGIYWTFNQNADKTNGTVASKAIAVGDYIFQLQVGKRLLTLKMFKEQPKLLVLAP